MAQLNSFRPGDRVKALGDDWSGDIKAGNEFDVYDYYGQPAIIDNHGDRRTQPCVEQVDYDDEVDFALVERPAQSEFDRLIAAVAESTIAVGVAIGKREAAQAELDAYVEAQVKLAAERG